MLVYNDIKEFTALYNYGIYVLEFSDKTLINEFYKRLRVLRNRLGNSFPKVRLDKESLIGFRTFFEGVEFEFENEKEIAEFIFNITR